MAGGCSPPAGNQDFLLPSSGRDAAVWTRGFSPPLPAEVGPSAGITRLLWSLFLCRFLIGFLRNRPIVSSAFFLFRLRIMKHPVLLTLLDL